MQDQEAGELTPERLQQFEPFEGLDAHQLLLLRSQVQWRKVARKTQLFGFGDIDSNEYFLLSGEVELQSADGKRFRVAAGQPNARRQLARLRPRQYTAITTGPCELIVVDSDVLEDLAEELSSYERAEDVYHVSMVSTVEEMEEQELLSGFHNALQRNQFVLPSLPEVAMKVRNLLEDDNTNADMLAKVVNADPSIAAKLVRAANSPLYHGASKCDTTSNAIVRLGLNTTRQLVVSFAVRDLFSSQSPALRKRMLRAWQDSVEVGAISFVIARMVAKGRQLAEEAMLAGLLHNIGVIAILAYIENEPELMESEESIDTALKSLRAEAGEQILEMWKFPPEFVEVAKSVADWQRNPKGDADLCDIVQIALLHSYIRNKHAIPLPRIDQVPAFKKLPLGELSPELTIRILDEAREQIAEAKQLLSS
ncbi:HDOD domain-containing protein [Pseudomaricurvus alkylphenolicus]|jgi:HD-like signal output (HDOD) protein|uniref:HDOD domain-containing protein n=1 Tax=Pseudomaricurvus alkylphenolicus TaxID=1306991 RepID=UPI00141F7F04|nr:HDOD domain-containing protein [Pseudomaricurvus alkylphenolicus]NIB42040.1 HDOD domain-containing protein [Pseudomaricurvus alkylphenolicus]